MAFPVVAARATGRSTTTNAVSHAMTLPAGIVAGNLLVVIVACDQNPTISVDTGVSGSGWNQLVQGANGTTVSSNVFWKIAEGGDALTVTLSAADQTSHVSLRITGGYSVSGTSANGSSTNSNPPLHTPPQGAQDYLWIATRAGDSTVVATVAPTDFGNLQTQAAAGTAGASINTAERALNAASLDPGTFTSASEQWVSFTLAVSSVPPAQTLATTTLSDGDTFGAAVVTAAGPVALAPMQMADGESFGAATVTPGAVTLTAARYVDADAFGAHSAAPGAVAITAALVADTDAFGAATVSQGSAGGQSLAAGLFADDDIFAAPVVSVGPVVLVAARITDADAFGAAAVHPGPVAVVAARLADADTFGGASVAVGHLPGRAAHPDQSMTGGRIIGAANGGTLAQHQNGGALAASERGGRILNRANGGTLIEG